MTKPPYKNYRNWPIITLEKNPELEYILDVSSGSTPSTRVRENWDGLVLWLTPKEITQRNQPRYVYNTQRTLTQEGSLRAGQIFPANSVMLTKRAPVGAVIINKMPMATNQGFLSFVCGRKLIPEFLYYWLKINKKYLDVVANGSTYDELYAYTLFEFGMAVPTIPEQEKIVEFLGAVDGQIENIYNNIETLERIAQSIYANFFVNFEFPNKKGNPYKSDDGIMEDSEFGNIPRDWEIVDLEKLCDVITDGSHQSPKENLEGTKRIATVKNMDKNEFDIENCKKISDEDYDELVKNGCKPKVGDIVLSKDGTIGQTFVYLIEYDLVLLSSIAILSVKESSSNYFVHNFLLREDTQLLIKEGQTTGSALQRIILGDIEYLRILSPPPDVLKDYDELVEPLYGMISENLKELKILKKIRDKFRPKLISGKIIL